jgi:hypothetical protein
VFLVKGTAFNKSWVSAVLKEKQKADRYLKLIESQEGKEFFITPVYIQLPFVIMETRLSDYNTIRILSPIVADKEIRKAARENDQRHIFYPITDCFKVDPPGFNNMERWNKLDSSFQSNIEKLAMGVRALNI